MVFRPLLLLASLVCVTVGSYYDYKDDGNDYSVKNNDAVGDYYNDDYNNQYDPYYEKSKYTKPSRRYRGTQRSNNAYNYEMQDFAKSYKPKPKPKKVFVPVVIKKKSKKKSKIIAVHNGFYIPGGTQMFGKFKDLFSCKKACEITPTCFSGDFNPWLGKCYLHSNLTACAGMRSHKAITHFTKVPCQILETTRGVVVLGVNTINGIEIKGVKTLSDCIKKCATAGGGVAALSSTLHTEGQVCCHVDYDFATHKCYFHPCINMAIAQAQFCGTIATVNQPPLNSVANPTVVSITICPRSQA